MSVLHNPLPDPAMTRDLAARYRHQAQLLRGEVARLDQRLQHMPWEGPAAENLGRDWMSGPKHSLGDTAEKLDGIARKLERAADAIDADLRKIRAIAHAFDAMADDAGDLVGGLVSMGRRAVLGLFGLHDRPPINSRVWLAMAQHIPGAPR